MTLSPILKFRSFAKSALLLVAVTSISSATAFPPQQTGQSQEKSSPTAPFLPRGQKLILKDGSYQLVRSYEVQGDRVRYYSVERSEWEEIPASQVDWEATRKAAAEQSRQEQAELEKLKAAEAAARAEAVDVDASVEVAPGIFLPPGEGLFVVDGRAVLPMEQAESGLKLDKKRLLEQVLVPVPIIPSRRNIVLSGRKAKFRITNSQPEFYMRTADGREPQLELIRARVRGNSRQIASIDRLFTEQETQRNDLPLQRWDVAKGVYRFTLGQPLHPGEYAFAEILRSEGVNLFVWDFGVDRTASSHPAKPD